MRFDKYSEEDLRTVSRKAGIASGEARRAKRAAIEQEKRAIVAQRELFHREVTEIRKEARALLRYKTALDNERKDIICYPVGKKSKCGQNRQMST